MTSTTRLSSTAGFPAAAAQRRRVVKVWRAAHVLVGDSRGGVMDAFRRDLELMELIAAADAVVNARVDLEDAKEWLARPFS
jgi:hypothetical protein